MNTLSSPSQWRWTSDPRIKTFATHNFNDSLQPYIAGWATKTAFNAMDQKELSDLKAEQAEGVPHRPEAARRQHQLQLRQQADAPAKQAPTVRPLAKRVTIIMCMKSARCWAGYEPVPGKAPYSEDSCRPVSSGKKKKKGTPAKKK